MPAYVGEFSMVSVMLRLLLAVLCGGLIGLDREFKHRPAGFRTYILVCLGAALAMLLGQYESWALNALGSEAKTDVSRIGAQVVSGIGFLGAGTILLTGRRKIKGLTTAAGLWASACMGLAIGAGAYAAVFAAFFLILLCMRVFPLLEARMLANARNMNLYVEVKDVRNIVDVTSYLRQQQIELLSMELYPHSGSDAHAPGLLLDIRLPKKANHELLRASLLQLEAVRLIEEI